MGGAGVVLWKHTRGALTFIDSLCIPLYPCPDAAHAEASGAAGAVHLAATHFPSHTPSRLLIKGDNRAVIDFMTNAGKFRRADLQQSLQSAHHLLAFRLPPCVWSYTPREFNKCADFLAGIAHDHTREYLSLSPSSVSDLVPFPFPLPPWLSATFSPSPSLRLAPTSAAFTFPEQAPFSPSLLPLLFRHYSTPPHILKYLRALSRTPSTELPTLMIAYRPSAPDNLGRLYPFPLGAAKLPKELRFLLFGRTHTEIDLVSAHYQLFSCVATHFLHLHLPTADTLRSTLESDMQQPPLTILRHLSCFGGIQGLVLIQGLGRRVGRVGKSSC